MLIIVIRDTKALLIGIDQWHAVVLLVRVKHVLMCENRKHSISEHLVSKIRKLSIALQNVFLYQ